MNAAVYQEACALPPKQRAEGIRWTSASGGVPASVIVATEVPFTIVANDCEVATLLATPQSLKELTYGYLFTSGFIREAAEVLAWSCDNEKWCAQVTLHTPPDPGLMRKRLYTAGCGKCAMYASINEIGMRRPCESTLRTDAQAILAAGRWIAECSAVFRESGGVHAAGLFDPRQGPRWFFEDVARHNAVDKAIGRALLEAVDMSRLLLVRTGRTSSEILFKTKRAGIPVTIARGAPTNQAILLSKEMGITLVGFARDDEFTVYTNPERIDL